LIAVVGMLALAPSAMAGRLLETGHDIDFHCAASTQQCNFVKRAVIWARSGAPNPSKPVLVFDKGATPDVPAAINKAFGTGVVPMQVVDPGSITSSFPNINTLNYSAIFVASDTTCFGCDLNNFPSSGAASTPDSTKIYSRVKDIAAFFDAGGGIVAGSGADNSGNIPGGPSFDSNNVPYYAFVATAGGDVASGPFAVTPIGAGLGLTNNDLLNSCPDGCTHNSFGFPPAGSRLKPAEVGSGRYITLVQDTDAPTASITSGPTATGRSSRRFTFSSNERERPTFQCRVDNAAFGACSSPWTATGLSDGRHTVNVRAIDLVGNVQPTPTSRSFCVPGTAEVAGNKVDEDCNGFSAPFDPVEATIRFAFRFTRASTQVTTLNLAKVTRGASLRVTCRGKGCPFKSKRVKLRKGKAKLSRIFKKRGKRAKLRRRARIRISLTKPGLISKVYNFKIRRGALPSFATRCQLPGSKRLRSSCPSFQ